MTWLSLVVSISSCLSSFCNDSVPVYRNCSKTELFVVAKLIGGAHFGIEIQQFIILFIESLLDVHSIVYRKLMSSVMNSHLLTWIFVVFQ